MPKIYVPLPETSQSVTRPVIFDIIGQIRDITKIDPDTKIYYPGDIQKMQSNGSGIDNQDRTATFNSTKKNFIEVEEDYDKDAIYTTAYKRGEYSPVFKDAMLQTEIIPIYATSQVAISFKFVSSSKTEVLRWRDDMRLRVSQMRDVNLHKVTYHYLIPLEFYSILKAIHANREEKFGYGDDISSYIEKHCSDRMTIVSDIVGEEKSFRIGVSETQIRIIGLFDFEGIPDKAERDDNGTWSIGFTYKFSYEKPIACFMKYPVTVHNQLLPKKYVDFMFSSYDLKKENKYFSSSLNALNRFESDSIIDRRMNTDALIRLPSFDDYIIRNAPRSTGTVFTALCEVNETNFKTLLDLTDLDEMMIDEDIMKFIREVEYPYVTKLYKSIINFTLYRNDELCSFDMLNCSKDSIISSRLELNPRNQYRVRMSFILDLTLLDKAALKRLFGYPEALVKIIKAINEIFIDIFPEGGDFPFKKPLTPWDFNPIYNVLTGFDWTNPEIPGDTFITGSTTTVGPGRPTISDPTDSPFRNLNPRVVENYRNNRIGMNTVQLTGVMAFRTKDIGDTNPITPKMDM